MKGTLQLWSKLHSEWEKSSRLRVYHGWTGFSAMDDIVLTSYKKINNLDKEIEDLQRGIYNEKRNFCGDYKRNGMNIGKKEKNLKRIV